MKRYWGYIRVVGAVSLLGVVGAACADTAGARRTNGTTVSVVAVPVTQTAAQPNAVEIAELRLVLGGIKLETAGVDGTVDLVLAESRVIEVDLSGQPVTAYTVVDVPPGTYKEVEISVDKLEPGNSAEEPLIALHSDLADASIAISGQVLQDGSQEPFTFTAALDRDMEILLGPFLVISEDQEPAVQLTLSLNTEGWFRDAAGEWLDPRDPANRSVIEANIQASFEAFEDGHVDGVPGPIAR